MKKYALLFGWVAIASPAPAKAQVNFPVNWDLVTQPVYATLLNPCPYGVCPGAEPNDDDSKNRGSEVPAPRASVPSLTYSPSLPMRRASALKYAQSLKASDPSRAVAIDQFFWDGQIIDQIDQMMRPIGLRADNVADAYAIWWVAAWKAANNKNIEGTASMYRSVKQQAANALLSTPDLLAVQDVQKQEVAEMWLMQAVLIDAQSAAVKGNDEQQALIAKAVNDGARKMGLDLTSMDLTEQGFVLR